MKRGLSVAILVSLLTCTLIMSFNTRPAKTSLATIIVPDDYSTIQEAIDHASDGGTVSVRNGMYYENIVVGKNGLTLVGEDNDTTIIDGSETGTVSARARGHENLRELCCFRCFAGKIQDSTNLMSYIQNEAHYFVHFGLLGAH